MTNVIDVIRESDLDDSSELFSVFSLSTFFMCGFKWAVDVS